jgi:DNA-binding response OmpR family regulator
MNFSSDDEAVSAVVDAEPIVVGLSRVCPRTGVVETADHSQKPRRKELELIRYLNANAGRIVSRDELLSQVWKCPAMMTRTVDQTISSLRRKVGDDADTPRYVITVYGVGYTLGTSKRQNDLPA